MLFHIIEDCFVVLREKGMFRQASVYRRSVKVYANVGPRFVQLMHRGGTSRPNMLWEDLTANAEIVMGANDIPIFKQLKVGGEKK